MQGGTTHNTRLAARLRGLWQKSTDPQWPSNARIALNFNLNYETGGEANLLDGDPASEGMLNDIGFRRSQANAIRSWNRPLSMARGSGSGVYFASSASSTFLSVCSAATALERNLEVTRACVEGGHEISAMVIAGSTIITLMKRWNVHSYARLW